MHVFGFHTTILYMLYSLAQLLSTHRAWSYSVLAVRARSAVHAGGAGNAGAQEASLVQWEASRQRQQDVSEFIAQLLDGT